MHAPTRLAALLCLIAPLYATVAPPDWVPARWRWTDAASLDLVRGTPINCLLLKWNPDQTSEIASFATRAAERGLVTLAVIYPGGDPVDDARKAMRSKLQGIVLEGDFPEKTAARVRDALADSKAVVIELTARRRMKLGAPEPIIGTYQGVWPGIQVLDNGATKAGPTGSAWIDTNSGFIRSVRASGNATVWLGNLPPDKTVVTGERYLQVICDAAMVGARWVLALDDDFAGRLHEGDAATLRQWQRMAQHLKFYEDHADWKILKPWGKLALIQDAGAAALLSGGILDMIAVKHTPVRPVPRQQLSLAAFKDVSMAVNVDADALTAEQREILRSFARSGGTLLTGPPGWKDQITLEKDELERLNDIWHDVQSMIGRKNLGARLFNVSSMLSNLVATEDGKQVVVHLVNYSNYPVENVAVHFLGEFKRARLYTPDAAERTLEVYKNEEGTGVDIDQVSTSATLRLD